MTKFVKEKVFVIIISTCRKISGRYNKRLDSDWQSANVAMRKEQNKYEVCGAVDVYSKQSESAERMKVVQDGPGEERVTRQEGEENLKR